MRDRESNKWLRNGVEHLGDDDLLDLYEQMLDDGDEKTRYGVALIDEVRSRWLSEKGAGSVDGAPTCASDALLKIESGEAMSWQQQILDLVDYVADTTADEYDADIEDVCSMFNQAADSLHEEAKHEGDEQ